ncbi:hypothetical protein GGS23DRAFT_616241 [Durotheca rogersii]|uniref:uncharacterized protein n=1 Tax=Durotheca rogersii TaxID=419775 RepID=UPI002220C612|nr:uncharacterized protein GGS23DRAFT_616241 [Durotheca rogersii]KAI5859338.1 hypothetical protein GGS23DRAFT_616241 [Durotheca rogersii]
MMNNMPTYLPAPPTLEGIENLEDWKSSVLDHLRLHKLQRFVEEHVPVPAKGSFERSVFEHQRLHAKILVTQTLGAEVKKALRREHGWDQEAEEDPKVVWDLVLAAVPRVGDEGVEALAQRLGRADARRHASLGEFADDFVGARRHLALLGVEVGDGLAKWLLLAALRPYDAAWHAALLRDHHPDRASWAELVAEVAARARREAAAVKQARAAAAVAAKLARPPSAKPDDPPPTAPFDDPTVLDCSVCGHEHESTWAWCKGCKKHHSQYWKCVGLDAEDEESVLDP